MDISEDVSPDEMMVHHNNMSSSSILMPESAVPPPARGQGAGAGAGAGVGSAELGRRLLQAARHGDTQLVLDLMAKGAPFTTDWLGTSALHCAAGAGHASTCLVLLRAGVSRDCRTKVERTPLHLAAHAGHAEVTALLLAHRAAPHARDMLHMTALHWAAERDHPAAAARLLAHGADPLALSKFNKSPLSIATDKKHRRILQLIRDALQAREAADSVESLRRANETEIPDPLRSIDPSDGPQEASGQTTKRSPRDEPIEISIERPLESAGEQAAGAADAAGAASAAGASAAAAMLRRHGIALLPRDEGSTVLSALQSGRSVVLSDAGKLMLKESSEIPHVIKSTVHAPPTPTPAPSPAPTPTPAAASKGVLLTATPIKSPPRQGVKIFTLNNKLLAMPKENKAPVKKVINPHDSMQIQYIKLPSDAKISATKAIPMKAKHKLSGSIPSPSPSPHPRAPVKLTMQKAHLNKLVSAGDSGAEPGGGAGGGGGACSVLFVPEEFLTNSSPRYLRAQLLAAHRTIAALRAQLDLCRAHSH